MSWIFTFPNGSRVFASQGALQQHLISLGAKEIRREETDCYITVYSANRTARFIMHIKKKIFK